MSSPHLVAQGAYGCVHRPALRCATGTHSYRNKISKILTRREADTELAEYDKIERVDPLNYFHLPTPTQCVPNGGPINKRALIDCKITTKKEGPFRLLLLADGGKDLVDVDWDAVDVDAFLVEVRRLFMGVELFVGNGYAHTDIKPHNIVYDTKRGRINYIDFGMMTTLKHMTTDTADNKWYYYPLDFQFVRGPKGDIRPEAVLSYVAEQNSRLSLAELKAEYEKMAAPQCRGKRGFARKSVASFDTYQLGLTLMYVLDKIGHRLDRELDAKLFDLFWDMMRVDLWKRIDIKDATKAYEILLNRYVLGKKVSPSISRVLKQQEEIPTADSQKHSSSRSSRSSYAKIPSPLLSASDSKSRQKKTRRLSPYKSISPIGTRRVRRRR